MFYKALLRNAKHSNLIIFHSLIEFSVFSYRGTEDIVSLYERVLLVLMNLVLFMRSLFPFITTLADRGLAILHSNIQIPDLLTIFPFNVCQRCFRIIKKAHTTQKKTYQLFVCDGIEPASMQCLKIHAYNRKPIQL